jgi:hypothetical protein
MNTASSSDKSALINFIEQTIPIQHEKVVEFVKVFQPVTISRDEFFISEGKVGDDRILFGSPGCL